MRKQGRRDQEGLKVFGAEEVGNWPDPGVESMKNHISNLSKQTDGRVGRGRYKLLFVGGNEMMDWSQFRKCWVWDTSEASDGDK